MKHPHTDPPHEPDLPDYSEDRELPPGYSPPRTYTIAGRVLHSPLVRLTQVKAHLALLRAVKNLRSVVENGEDPRLPKQVRDLPVPQRWGWFIHLEVERFWRWVQVVKFDKLRPWTETQLPPLDVLMVWHTYMLNPAWYAEDCDRIPALRTLGGLKDRLLNALVLLEDISVHQVSAERRAKWEAETETPFDPIDAAAQLTHHRVPCAFCRAEFAVPYLAPAGTGYAQHAFVAQCPVCGETFTKVHLAVRKFAHDVAVDHHDTENVARYGHGVYVAGTLRTAVRADDAAKARRVKDKLRVAYPLNRPEHASSTGDWELHILRTIGGEVVKLKAAAAIVLYRASIRVQRVLSAYTDDRPFSVDLVNAVMRQCSFIDKMHEFGWTAAGCFDSPEDELVLQHAIARYHGFLDLLSASPTTLHVPTLDIDLIWHTHQLMGSYYHADCGEYLGKYIDHNDKVEESFLATSFDVTCRQWRDRFGAPYTYCGCPLPGDRIGERFSRLKQRMSGKTTEADPDLVPINQANGSTATHASEHSSFVASTFDRDTDARRKHRAEKMRKREKRERLEPGCHAPPFLYPIPFIGQIPEAGCVVVGGNASHDLGCAVGSGACAGSRCGTGCVGDSGGPMMMLSPIPL